MKIINYFIYLFLILFFYKDNCKEIFNYDLVNNNVQDYKMIINIPEINLNVKVYEFKDKRNNVDKGIYLVKDYDFSTLKGSLILASHSGNSPISYFKSLHLLKKNNLIRIDTGKYEYIYNIEDIFYITKNGKFKYKNKDKSIYLITCDKKNKKKQLVIYGNLGKIIKKSYF